MTFAFQTRKGDLGILQVIRFTEEPRGMRIRYKLVRPSAEPAAVPAPKPREAERATTFRTAAITRGDLVATIVATGTVEPEQVVDVGANVAGQISCWGPMPTASRLTTDRWLTREHCWRESTPHYTSPGSTKRGRVLYCALAEVALAQAKQEPADVAKASVAAAKAAVAQSEAALYTGQNQPRQHVDQVAHQGRCDRSSSERRQNVGPTPNAPGCS